MDKPSTIINQIANFFVFGMAAMTFNEWMMLIGLGISALTFFTNIYFGHKRNELLAREVEHKINSKIACGECAKCITD